MRNRPIFVMLSSGVLLGSSIVSHAETSVSAGSLFNISGPAGLDLEGEMSYAINFSANDGPLYVKGVRFTPDTQVTPGLTFGPNSVTPWQTRPNFGTGIDADSLEQIFEDMRWASTDAGQTLQAHLPVVPGEQYKLQVLFYGNGAAENRRWDIQLEGALVVDEVTSLGASGAGGALPAYSASVGVVYTHTFIALDNSADVVMGDLGGLDDGGDRNPLWQAITLERIVPDSDLDGLPDAWELAKFGNLLAIGTADADTDGLTNQYEYQLDTQPKTKDTDGDGLQDGNEYFTRGTNPKLPDTDGDGLNDGPEITAGSNPLIQDTDGDGLLDGPEVNTHGTNPADADSDNDDYNDNVEVAYGTNANLASQYPLFSSYMTTFTGGDQNEGLDFDGSFLMAARFGPAGMTGTWTARNATFRPYDLVSGLTQDAPDSILSWAIPAFPGTQTTNDNSLSTALRSVRLGGPVVNIAKTGLTVGRAYKVQMLFTEACCANRGFDIFVEGALVSDNFAPSAPQGGPSATPSRGVAFIHGFRAGDTTLNIRLSKLGVSDPLLDEPNVMVSAISVEEISSLADADSDGLPDLWEMSYFGNATSQGGGGDPDGDGLNNVQEYAAYSSPSLSDTDGDGLADNAEWLVHLSNPRMADTDDDGLTDGFEVNQVQSSPIAADTDKDTLPDGEEVLIFYTSPLTADTDGDGFNDPTEIITGSDPALALSRPLATYIARVLGPDPGEGLDLDGNFRYAVNVGPNGASGAVRGAAFTADNAAGVTLSAGASNSNWVNPNFGSTTADNNLEAVFRDMRWSDLQSSTPALRTLGVDLAGIVPGRVYKLQLLFSEAVTAQRTFDVVVDGSVIMEDFSPGSAQGAVPMNTSGVALVHQFFAADTTLNILLDGSGVFPFPGFDGDPVLSGFTLEELGDPVPLALESSTLDASGISFRARGTPGREYSVDFSPDMVTWSEVNPNFLADVLGDAVWTDTEPSRVGSAATRGFYKLRDPLEDPTP